MTFSLNKKELIKHSRSQAFLVFFLALVVAALMFLPAIITGQGYFIFYGDFNVQQIPFYQNCHEAIKSGNLFWNTTTDLGSNFIGAYSFYLLGSPFFWLTLPFDTSFVPYLMGPLLVLKFACAALTAYLYIRRYTKTSAAASVGGLLYAFSGFSVYNIFFNHFHEPIIVFPLLLLAFDLLWTENRRGVFALCVALSAVVNYFFFVGMAVFCLIYFIIRLLSGAIKFKFGRFCTLVFETLLGVLLAAFLLLPSVLMVSGNGRVSEFQIGWGGILYGREQIYFQILQSLFFPPDIPAHPVFVPSLGVKWSSIAAYLPVVGLTCVLGFCSSKPKHWLKRVLCVCAVMAVVPILNSAFYAFNDSYYARWYYMPVLLMCLATSFTFEDSSINWKKGFRLSALFTVLIALVIGLFPQIIGEKLVFGLYADAGEKDNVYFYRFLLSCLIAILCLLICRGLIALREHKKALMSVAICAILIVSLVYGAVFINQGQYYSSNINETMIPLLIEGEVQLPKEEANDYRIDTYDCVDNTGMYLGYPTINAFHSVVSPSIMDFYDYIGIERNVASRPSTDYTFLRSILSVKYLLNRTNGNRFVDEEGNTIMPGYEYLNTIGGYYVYENTNYIPYGFSYDYYITENECKLLFDKKERADIMLKALVVPDDIDYSLLEGLEHLNVEKLEAEGEIEIDGETGEVVIPETNGEYTVSLKYDNETLSSDAFYLKETAASEFSYNKKGFTATVERDKQTLVFFSVPFDEGFTATVNGKKAEIVKANVGFMAVKVEAGVSKIEFEYETPGLYMGIKISFCALIVFVIYLLISIPVKRKRKAKEVYPEGDELIALWCRQQAKESNETIEFENESDTLITQEKTENGKYDTGFHIDLSEFLDKDGNLNKTDQDLK